MVNISRVAIIAIYKPMKVTPEQHEAAYRMGLNFFESQGSLKISEAKKRLEATGLNPNTSADFIYGVKCLLLGRCYKRALSERVTDDYLTWIYRDRGLAAQGNAVEALRLHIAYYEEKFQVCRHGLRNLLQKHEALHRSARDRTLG